ncbi:hypothetical protein RRG08_045052 [Elysia crispata]|uniref:Uncharacterized protein n=1 Tax=Elysia crispata TaxID=231223 RepID=A0AAE1CLX5_9GAST|nr:hypothetical protein RRG08_045052 [Elysia crispata]
MEGGENIRREGKKKEEKRRRPGYLVGGWATPNYNNQQLLVGGWATPNYNNQQLLVGGWATPNYNNQQLLVGGWATPNYNNQQLLVGGWATPNYNNQQLLVGGWATPNYNNQQLLVGGWATPNYNNQQLMKDCTANFSADTDIHAQRGTYEQREAGDFKICIARSCRHGTQYDVRPHQGSVKVKDVSCSLSTTDRDALSYTVDNVTSGVNNNVVSRSRMLAVGLVEPSVTLYPTV